MEGGDQRGKLVSCEVLQFINEEDDRRIGFARGTSDLLKESCKIALEIAIVGKAGFGLEVEAYFYIVIFQLQGFCKTSERTETLLGEVSSAFDTAQSVQNKAEGRSEESG